jgi:pimeloyl-ACP methyl ester carboxylesterase
LAVAPAKNFYSMAIDFKRHESGLMKQTLPIGARLQMTYYANRPKHDPTLVLVHGFGVSKEVWLPFAAAMHGRYGLVIPDLIGDGESSRPAHLDYLIEAQARRLHLLLKRLRISHPVLVGNSTGAPLHWLTHHATRPGGLC